MSFFYRTISGVLALARKLTGVDYTQADKRGHFWLGAATSAISILVIEQLHLASQRYVTLATVICVTAAVAALKEVYDYFHPLAHTCDFKDFVATITGGILVALALFYTF